MSRTRPEDPRAVRIEVANEWAWCGAQRLRLTPRTFAVLRHLVEHPGRLITKEELFTTVWRDTIVSDAALASCIRDLRKALGDSSGAPRYIETVHRRGFRFIGPIPSPDRRPGSPPETYPCSLVTRDPDPGRPRGRARAALRARLAKALSGQRQLVFVTGEPGIGKTALVETFLAEVGAANALRIGRGQCVEQYGAGEAYLPVLEALGRLGRAAGGEQTGPDPQAACADLAGAAAGVAQRSRSGGGAAPGAGGDARPDAARAGGGPRRADPRRAARPAPGRPALERLRHHRPAGACSRGRREASRLLVLGTYRPADVAAEPAHPLRRVKHELQLHGHCDEIPLEFLSRGGRGQYLSRRFPGHALPPGAGARAPSEHGRQSPVPGEHDRRPDRPGAAAARSTGSGGSPGRWRTSRRGRRRRCGSWSRSRSSA